MRRTSTDINRIFTAPYRRFPSVAETWNYRGTTLQHRDALAAYERAIALKPYLTEPWLVLSLVLSLLGNHEGRSLRPPSCQIIIERLDDAGDVS
jgi:hypothetical protein